MTLLERRCSAQADLQRGLQRALEENIAAHLAKQFETIDELQQGILLFPYDPDLLLKKGFRTVEKKAAPHLASQL